MENILLNNGSFNDIYAGDIYKNHVKEGRLGKIHQISYSLATGGVQYLHFINNINYFRRANKGKNLSVWPLFLISNELEPSMYLTQLNIDIFTEIRFKKEHIQFLGIWFDSEKPDMNTFLTPITQMFINSWTEGMILKFVKIQNIGINVTTYKKEKLHTTALLLPGNLPFIFFI